MKKKISNFWKTYKNIFLVSLWVPLIWILLLVIEVGFLVDSNRAKVSVFARLFEDLVFVMSFLFYSSQGMVAYLERPLQLLITFALQFFFWWALSFLILLVLKRFSRKTKSISLT